MMSRLNKALSGILALPVHLYRLTLSPFLGRACRHVPTCSQYMLDALRIHGPFTGLLMGTARILRCSPWGTHGYDPVPILRFKKYKPLNSWTGKWKSENRLKR
ncbi:MAG TPA: membrane protein insertion efficiency factor YidD [Bacteroidales bacterium]|nr:membrane protein insertion efficiency factor YidD [Bacteroidales bacterium]